MVTHAKNGKGIVHPYFICAGRYSKRTNCVRQAMPIEHIERQVEDYYRRVQIPEHIVTALRQMLVRQFDDLHTANKAARHTLAVERDKLRDERRSLLHAHHTGAVPLDLLKEEQDRIVRRLVFLDSQNDAGQIEYDQAKAHLDDCLALAGDMHAIYMSIDDSLRRICIQAFFERIHMYEIENADIVTVDPGEPFDALPRGGGCQTCGRRKFEHRLLGVLRPGQFFAPGAPFRKAAQHTSREAISNPTKSNGACGLFTL